MYYLKNMMVVALVVMVTGCSMSSNVIPPYETQAFVPEATHTFKELLSLPKPKGPITVSVYGFRDQTGQYRPMANMSSFSTAVTQGGSSILMRALQASDWFIPVEREGLQNVLTERKIIRAALKEEGKNQSLPPLMTAQIIFEGGIVGFDSNIRTGGAGVEYFGISTSEQYREDQVTVYLRAVDVRSGRVLISVSSSKTMLSKEVRAGFFRFVSFKRLAEAEIGHTTNEPAHLVVRQAIEKGVSTMIVRGVLNNLWGLNDQADMNHPTIQAYAKREQEQRDFSNADWKGEAAL